METVNRLIEIMKRLRDPVSGCPWDREQTLESILPHTIEEVHELADAIQAGRRDHIVEELGDLLFHIVFYARIAEESGNFTLADIAASAGEKLLRRHPHIFGDAGPVASARDQSREWEKHKAAERAGAGRPAGLLDGIPAGLPALLRAHKLQRRAATAGFDWTRVEDVLAKLDEELGELRDALDRGAGKQELESETGDILFAAINCARHLDVDPELALRGTNKRFEQRFAWIEAALTARGKSVFDASLEEMEALWQQAKQGAGKISS